MTSPNFLELVRRLEAHQAAGEWPAMMLEITNIVIAVVNDPRAKGLVFGSAELDRFCLAAGAMSARHLGLTPPTDYNDHVAVHVATELYDGQGGHSLALKDVIRARPDLTHVVVVTNLHDRTLPLERFNRDLEKPVQIVLAPKLPLQDKMGWLQMQLATLRPGLLTLFNHHYDTAAIGAAQPGVARETAYFHHADHDMALGVFLPHALHVDCTNLSHHKCQHYLGVHNPVYWPLVSPDLGMRQGHAFMAGGGLLTCSHGSVGKFMSPGRHDYFDVMQRRLAEVGGSHLHIGLLPDTLAPLTRAAEAAAQAEIWLEGRVSDGAGEAVGDAIVELWDASTGQWLRSATDDGMYRFALRRPAAAFVSLLILARGINVGLHTRAYLQPAPDDALLATLGERAATLAATPQHSGWRFDIRLQGEAETVFLEA